MKYYIATSLGNAPRALRLSGLLTALGHTCTFDWMSADPVSPDDPRNTSGALIAVDPEALAQRGARDYDGVAEATALIAILPGGQGTHFELGVAYALLNAERNQDRSPRQAHRVGPRRQVFIWTPDDLPQSETYPCVFHSLPDIVQVSGDIADCLVAVQSLSQ